MVVWFCASSMVKKTILKPESAIASTCHMPVIIDSQYDHGPSVHDFDVI